MAHRRLVLAFAFTIMIALLALVLVTTPALSLAPPPAASVPTQPSGPPAELVRAREYQTIAAVVSYADATAKARWYTEVARRAAEQAQAQAQAQQSARRTDRTGSSAPPAPPTGGGDALAAIARYFPDVYNSAVGVADCESSLDPSNVSKGGGNWGLFQINRPAHRSDFEAFAGALLDEQGAKADDPRRVFETGTLDAFLNAAYARKLYDGHDGWGPWSCAWAA